LPLDRTDLIHAKEQLRRLTYSSSPGKKKNHRGMCAYAYVGMNLCMGKSGESSLLHRERTHQDRNFFLSSVFEKKESQARSPKSKILKRI